MRIVFRSVAILIICSFVISFIPITAFASNDPSNAITSIKTSVPQAVLTNTTTESTITFPSSNGGTLVLDYTGEYSLLSNTIRTKTIYYTAQEVVFLQHALYSDGFADFLLGLGVTYGAGKITDVIAAEIASYLNLPYAHVLTWIGVSIDILISVLELLEKVDFDMAVEESTTGKLMLEFYYTQSAFEPYFIAIENYSPWNDDIIEVPEDYDYMWYEGVFDYESQVCTHNYTSFESVGGGLHKKTCSLCNGTIVDICDYSISLYNHQKHKLTCDCCGYTTYELHEWNVGGNRCLVCGFNTELSVLSRIKHQGESEALCLM